VKIAMDSSSHLFNSGYVHRNLEIPKLTSHCYAHTLQLCVCTYHMQKVPQYRTSVTVLLVADLYTQVKLLLQQYLKR
jgi:hypothetical protein